MAIGTFGAFTQARLAIYAAQTGLNVTGNNISNINTPGYTRQRLDQVSLYAAGSDRYYAKGDIRTGQGALVKSLSQIRSPYLDIRFRTENAKVGYMDAKLEGLNEIATILDEVAKGDVSKGEDGFGILGLYFNKIAEAMRDLTSETGHQEYDNTVRQVAQNLVSTFNAYANKLEKVRQDTINKIGDDLDDIKRACDTVRIPILYCLMEFCPEVCFTLEQLRQAGLRAVCWPNGLLMRWCRAATDLVEQFKQTGSCLTFFDQLMPIEQCNQLLGIQDWNPPGMF